MAETTATASGAPDTIEVGKGKDRKTLRISPLRLREMGMWERFVHARLSECAKGIAGGDVKLAEAMLAKISAVTFWDAESIRLSGTMDGELYMTWLAVSIEEPGITWDWYAGNVSRKQLNSALDALKRFSEAERTESKKAAEVEASSQ